MPDTTDAGNDSTKLQESVSRLTGELATMKAERDAANKKLLEITVAGKVAPLLAKTKLSESAKKQAEGRIVADVVAMPDLSDDAKVTEAVSKRTATEIEYLGAQAPKVSMPATDGEEALREAKNQPTQDNKPITSKTAEVVAGMMG